MYAVINNSMGSGSVTYECEGHETRLSDCMSPLSSTIAPCYYALVKCFSATDKGSGESTTSPTTSGSSGSGGTGPGGSTTSGLSAGIVAGVVASLIAALLVVTIIVTILVVWLKRRDKNLKPTDNTHTTTSPQSFTSPAAVIAGPGANNVTFRSLLQSSQTVEQNHTSTAAEAGLSAINGSFAGIV